MFINRISSTNVRLPFSNALKPYIVIACALDTGCHSRKPPSNLIKPDTYDEGSNDLMVIALSISDDLLMFLKEYLKKALIISVKGMIKS